MEKFQFVTFLSDYGLTDEFVGVCHGVIHDIAPHVDMIDITHGIRPQNVSEGAMVLAQSIAYMPRSVHLAVVDPAVGSSRHPIVVATRDGSRMVGPDNGLLSLAAVQLGGIEASHLISNPDMMLPRPSRTFHGRDIFAPAAAHLANGVPIEEMGEEIDPEELVGLTFAEPRLHDDHYHASILHIDRFGNIQLNLTPKHLDELGLTLGSMLELRIEGHRRLISYGEAYASVRQGDLVATEDSHGLVAIAVNFGSASDFFGASLGSSVIIGAPGSGAGD